jgi:acyl-CoA thioesterase FadM
VVATQVERIGRTSVTFGQRVLVLRDGIESVAADATCTIVFTDQAMKTPQPVPEEFKRHYA